MTNRKKGKEQVKSTSIWFVASLIFFFCLVLGAYVSSWFLAERVSFARRASTTTLFVTKPPLDKKKYDQLMWALANNGTSTMPTVASSSNYAWPVKAPYPNAGALLPFKRIVAYYGNFYSTRMGVLGEYPKDEMLSRFRAAIAEWEQADPTTPVVPAIDYIAITAQASPIDGTYRARMPSTEIDKALALADEIHGIVILDIQVGLSTLEKELPLLKEYLSKPNVHLAIDPEFSMKTGAKPGDEIGTFSAADVNYAAQFLAHLVREHDLPPKVLVVHRFTRPMVTGYKNIRPLPEVQIVVDMDGWGPPAKKINTYESFVASEPIQFTGFKLFYKNDLKPPSTRLLTPTELLELSPRPIFIQYQ